MMTRLEQELSGKLGPFWVKQAQKELEKAKAALESGNITIDEAGIARNCIGRVLMDDMQEIVAKVTDKINVEATQKAREAEVHADLEKYRAQKHQMFDETKAELVAAFGSGTTVVDVISGETIFL